MKPLYTEKEFEECKSRGFLTIECLKCRKPFKKSKNYIQADLAKGGHIGNFCSRNCNYLHQSKKVTVNCKNCSKKFLKKLCEVRKSKNHFCTRSCSVTYSNNNKTKGYRRSKYEILAEEFIVKEFPKLKFSASNRSLIGMELDFYFPDLNLAIEINGIFHYKKIYDNFERTVLNDLKKKKLCKIKNIRLKVLNISKYKKFDKDKEKFLKRFKEILIKEGC